jgi:hypothetical protein
VLTASAVLGTANHYLADVLAGAGPWLPADLCVRRKLRQTMIERRGAVREASVE